MITRIRHCSFLRTSPLIKTLWVLTLATLVMATPAVAQTYGGRAFSALVNAPTLGVGPLYLSDTGSLTPQSDTWLGAGSMSENVPAILSADTMNATTSGSGGEAGSIASLADITVFSGQAAQLTASFVQAQTHAGAGGGLGTVQIYNLTLGGLPVTITGLPNQVVSLPGVATLIINEQTISADGNNAVVNALRLTLVTGDQVTLASASSQVTNAGLNPLASLSLGSLASRGRIQRAAYSPKQWRILPVWEQGECIDFITGGGYFEPPHSTQPGRVNFGFNAGPRSVQNPELKGNVNVVDHGSDTSSSHHIQGTTVDEYNPAAQDPENCRYFRGDAKFDGTPGYRYEAKACDYGEPGRDDTFFIFVFSGTTLIYEADNLDNTKVFPRGELDGGNIQLHKSKCPKTSSSTSSQSSF